MGSASPLAYCTPHDRFRVSHRGNSLASSHLWPLPRGQLSPEIGSRGSLRDGVSAREMDAAPGAQGFDPPRVKVPKACESTVMRGAYSFPGRRPYAREKSSTTPSTCRRSPRSERGFDSKPRTNQRTGLPVMRFMNWRAIIKGEKRDSLRVCRR
jgi:hypothetical protein